MSYLASFLPFDAGARLTAITSPRAKREEPGDHAISAHMIELPDYGQALVESGFLTTHLPHAATSFGGTDTDGSQWIAILQCVAVEPNGTLLGDPDPSRMLERALSRAMDLGRLDSVPHTVNLRTADLREAYTRHGVDESALLDWSTDDLIKGLVAELCGNDLPALVAGHAGGCAYPNVAHDCQGDVFQEVFEAWGARPTHSDRRG